MGFYVAFIIYLVLDLMVFKGPLARNVSQKADSLGLSPEALEASRAVAVVRGEVLTRQQLDAAVERYMASRGMDPEKVKGQRLVAIRYRVLDDLVNGMLLQIKTKYNTSSLAMDAPQVEEDVKALLSARPSMGEVPEETALRLKSRSLQSSYLENALKGVIEPGQSQIERVWRESGKEYVLPKMAKISVLFFPKGTEPGSSELEKIKVDAAGNYTRDRGVSPFAEAKVATTAVKFTTLNAREDDFPGSVWKDLMSKGEGKVAEFETGFGSGLALVHEIQNGRPMTFEEAKPYIQEWLRNQNRAQAVEGYFAQLRKEAEESKHFQIIHKYIRGE